MSGSPFVLPSAAMLDRKQMTDEVGAPDPYPADEPDEQNETDED